jgi:hypothetical protein
MAALILKRASALRRLWRWRNDIYDVKADDIVVGHIFLSPAAPEHRPWMWTSNEHQGRPPAFGYEATRDDALRALARAWGGEQRRC